jgi:alpha-D-ribose 1-methylphosphonate 5-triphosphate synthase subunit PhnL
MTSQANTNDRTETKTQSISRTELCRPVLTVKQLSKTFALHTVDETEVVGLDEVSFQVTAGEFLGVVGESGSGKSSLLKCIYRTYQATDGDILYHQRVQDQDNESGGKTPTEINLVSCSDREIIRLRKNAIGYTSQFLDEIPRVPAVDVVARPLCEQGFADKKARERAKSLLSQLRLPKSLWEAYPATFSGGERQRVNLAQAIAPKPNLLLLDEPTSALDPETRRAAVELLETYLDDDTTVIGVFHNADVVSAVADRIAVLDEAQLKRIEPAETYSATHSRTDSVAVDQERKTNNDHTADTAGDSETDTNGGGPQ